jgi:hypothetical protein
MKKALWQATVLVSAILTTSACVGQINREHLIVNIPFRFVAANQTLPPGRYVVAHLGETDIRIYNSQNLSVLVTTHTVQGKATEGTGTVVFRRYGETYVLSQIWFAATTTGRQVFRSRIEEELARTGKAEVLAVLQIKP